MTSVQAQKFTVCCPLCPTFPFSVTFPSPAMVPPFLQFLLQLWTGSWAQQHSRRAPESLPAPAKVVTPAKSPLLVCVLGSRFGMRFSFPLRQETTAQGKASNSFSYKQKELYKLTHTQRSLKMKIHLEQTLEIV